MNSKINSKIKRIFNFEKVNGKWKHVLNGELVSYFYQTLGVPLEILVDHINKKSKKEIALILLDSWDNFVEEGNVSKEEIEKIKEDIENNKEEYQKNLNLIFNK